VVSKLLSISTGTRTFDDGPRANILAVVNDKFVFIIPGTPKRPLAVLELILDSRCKCFIKGRTSPDILSEVGDGVDVHIDTAGKGYQVFEGTRSALDVAILTLPQYEQGETFAMHASQSLKLLPPLLRSEDRSADTEISSHTASRSFRRLNVGMIDVSRESDSAEDVLSASDSGSIFEVDARTSRRKLSRSRSRQSSRITEAKLKEARREKPSEPATPAPQGSLRSGGRQEFPTQSRSIDPRMLTRRKSNDMQADATAGIGMNMNMNFEHYVEQSKTQTEKEPGRRAKHPQPSAESRRNTIPTQRVESSPSNRVHRLPLKRPLEAARGTIDGGHPRQSLEPERSLAQRSSNKEMSEHHKSLQPRIRNADLEPTKVAGKTPAANKNNSITQPKKAQTVLRRSAKSRIDSASPLDWDEGDMADESSCLPTAKKPRLTSPTPKPAPRQSQGKAQAQEETMQLNHGGATSMLKRPKAASTKIQKPQQTSFQAKYDDFELEDDEEPAAPASNGGKATTKRAANVANKNLKSNMPNPAKGLSATLATKARKVLQPRDTNTSLASNRPRRSQPKSKKYNDESDSGIEDPNKEGEDIPEKTTSDTMIHKQTSVTEYELQKSAILAPRPRQTAGVSPRPIGSEEPNETQSDHELHTAPHIPIRRVTKTTEIAAAYETLVTASPTRLGEAKTRAVREERDGASELREARQQKTQLQETSIGAAGYDSPNETAEDSYPKTPTKSQDPRDSFGSKLGQLIQKAAPQGMNAMGNHATLLSNAKSFVGSVNETRITSPKKPRQSATASISKNGDAEVVQRAGSSTKRKEKAAAGKDIAPIAQTEKHATASSNENAKITTKASNGSPSPLTVAQQTHRAELSDSKKVPSKGKSISYAGSTSSHKALAPAPVIPFVPREKAELNESLSGQEDVGAIREDGRSHAIQGATQLRDTNMTVDLTQDSDEAISVTDEVDTSHAENGLGGIENEAATKAHITREPEYDDISLIRQGEQASQQPNRSARAKLRTPEGGTLTKNTPQNPKLPSAAGVARTSDLAASKREAPISRGSISKKSQLVHFDTRGPQNQGIPSPGKQIRKSGAAPSDTPEAKKNVTYKQSRFAAARRNPFVEVPTLQTGSADSADEVGDDGSGIIVENDTIIEDVGEAVQEGRENPVSKESALALTRHLLPQGSQSSRVDRNGSPRLPSPRLNNSTHLADSDMNGIAEINDEHNYVENEDLTASAEESTSESEELASQDSDQSFHLTNEAPLNRQSDRSIRSRNQASTTIVSPSKAVKQVQRRPASATMRVNSMPRESLGLGRLVQEQYPEAQKVVVTDSFKKPALRTAVSKPLNVSTKMPMVDHKAPAQASSANRQPLKEVSGNYKKTTVPEESSPNHATEFSSATPVRITEPQSKTPVQPHAASESLGETPGSLMTTLRVDHADRKVKEEDTILENLNRGKSAYRATKDADRTLVADDSIQQFRGRQPSDVSSVSLPPGAEPDTYSRQDDVHWRNGTREAQRGIHDALLEITDVSKAPFIGLRMLIRLDCPHTAGERRKGD
jgi:hypothetical protein